MSHIHHIQKNKHILELRSHILRAIREFFWSRNFLEVETPNLLKLPGQEPYLSPMKLPVHDETGKTYDAFLHTSPEYTMKKMLAAGFTNIFSICKTYRDYESFGGNHNPEFTMLEWYRTHANFYDIMDDVEALLGHIQKNIQQSNNVAIQSFNIENKKINIERVHMNDLWEQYAVVALHEYLSKESMYELCVQKGYAPKKEEPYEDLFYRIFLNEIEPKLKDRGVVIVHHYPAQMAALARISPEDSRYAERFELYINGIELANAFSELTDADEQFRRLEDEKSMREQFKKDVFEVDTEFLKAVEHMPECAGIALGIDRLAQVYAGCQDINDVLVLPASEMFSD